MPTKPSKSKLQIVLLPIAIIILLLGAWFYFNTHREEIERPVLSSATVFDHPRAISNFQLMDDHTKPFSLKNLQGHWNLVFFGFTNCPDLCPTTLAMLNQVYNRLTLQKQNPLPQIVFISVDPEQDSPKKIADYLSSFSPHFLGATGSPEQLDKLTKELNVLYTKVDQPSGNSQNYSIDHSGSILIINPKGEFYGVFTPPHNIAKITSDLQGIMNAKE